MCNWLLVWVHTKPANGGLSKYHYCVNPLSLKSKAFQPSCIFHSCTAKAYLFRICALQDTHVGTLQRMHCFLEKLYNYAKQCTGRHQQGSFRQWETTQNYSKLYIQELWLNTWWVFQQEPNEQKYFICPQTLHCQNSSEKCFWRLAFPHWIETIKILLYFWTHIL